MAIEERVKTAFVLAFVRLTKIDINEIKMRIQFVMRQFKDLSGKMLPVIALAVKVKMITNRQ
ncbi:hypothetical protein SAE01_25440 [Segetibacter aerophilus]|uniref:Uncharacterized protein n=1 Tax=Segetibacter aerophilus TaxID=670293 RepID=A0A512BDK9_9BACT|nr:hypothetical protein SAE01_25440 [Segetibacter aerophilus]